MYTQYVLNFVNNSNPQYRYLLYSIVGPDQFRKSDPDPH